MDRVVYTRDTPAPPQTTTFTQVVAKAQLQGYNI